ncbi:hypothetical protein [Brevibacterium oceani]|nr:hypothetical protein [Brevibacterium oceani]
MPLSTHRLGLEPLRIEHAAEMVETLSAPDRQRQGLATEAARAMVE